MTKSGTYFKMVIAFGAILLVWGLQTSPVGAQSPTSATEVLTKKDIAAYRIFFRRVTIYKQMTDAASAEGQDRSYLARSLQTRHGFGAAETLRIQQIAIDCERELTPLHAQTKAIIDQFHSQFPGNKIPVGVVVSRPAGVSQIEAQEATVILKYRGQISQILPLAVFRSADVSIRQSYGNPAMLALPATASGGVN